MNLNYTNIGGGAKLLAAAALIIAGVSSSAFAQQNHLDFTKNNNIYTNLNEQFPHSGTGVPGSSTGTANASFLFDPSQTAVTTAGYAPNYVSGSNQVNNGINFEISSNSAGADFEQIGDYSNAGPTSLTVSAGLNDVSDVYLLMGAYDGTSFNVTFNGSGGASETFSAVGLPDFNGGVGNGSINGSGTGSGGTSYLDQTVFITDDTGAGGSGNSITGDYNAYDLTETTFNLDAALQGQELTSFTITSNGYETLLLGATANGNAPSSSVPDSGATLTLFGIGLAALGALRRKLGHS